MLDSLNRWGPMTTLMLIVVTIAMGVGGAVVIVNPETLTFQQYLDDLKTFAAAVAGLAVARGVASAGKDVADSRVQSAAITNPAVSPGSGFVDAAPPTGLEVAGDLPSDEEELEAPPPDESNTPVQPSQAGLTTAG